MMLSSLSQSIAASKCKQLLLLLSVQALLILIGFNKIVIAPESTMFFDLWDGAKNYYSFLWYVQQPETVSYLFFDGMNHPYGEYIYYVDNTPIVAVLVRWVHLNIADLSGHFTAIYNLFMLSGILISTTVLFFILRKLGLTALWVFVGSLCLVWLHPQINKLSQGHFNLSFAWPLLLVFYGQLTLFRQLMAGETKKVLVNSLFLALAIVVAAFCHFYYLPLMLLWLGCFLGIMCLYQMYQRQWPWLPVVSGLIVAGISIAVSFGVIQLTDAYLDDRLVTGGGYGYRPWVLTFTDMFASYHFNTIQFIFQVKFSGHYESNSYWGNAALYGLLIIGLWRVWRYYTDRRMPKLGDVTGWWFFWFSVAFGAIVMLFIALSEDIETSPGHVWRNYFNLFIYIRWFTESVTQFRTLARFVWPLFWVVNLFVLWYVANRYTLFPKIIPAVIMLLLIVDTLDMIGFYNKTYYPNTFADKELQLARERLPIASPQAYQAILPIPYYHSGSDNYDITIDAETYWGREAKQISLAYHLPLMSSQLARTANYQAMNLLGLFQGRGIDPEMIQLMDDRPVLVIIKRKLSNPCGPEGEIPDTWAINVCNLELVWQNEQYQQYEWYPKSNY